MKEITQSTGIKKSTVLYYRSLGLLPEPEKSSKNTACYPSAYLDIIPAIRYLQENERLPLSVIKQLIENIGFENFTAEYALHYYKTFLSPLKRGDNLAVYTGGELENRSSLSADEINELTIKSLLFPSSGGSYYDGDLFAAAAYKRLKDLGLQFSDIEKLTGVIKELANKMHELYHEKSAALIREEEEELSRTMRKEFETIFDYLLNNYFLLIYKNEQNERRGK